jgi:endonuclease-3
VSAQEPLPKFREKVADRRIRLQHILDELKIAYPKAKCALDYESPWQLLVATILSAQCTDERVNMVTPGLFAEYPDSETTASADQLEIEELIRSAGFFRQKAKNIIRSAQIVETEFDGAMPDTMDDLVTLPGAARKTANVVISECFPDNAAGIAVDTHVQRIARRLALTKHFEPPKIEQDLMKLAPRDEWNMVAHRFIHHGRAICTARAPQCPVCPIAELCPSRDRFV